MNNPYPERVRDGRWSFSKPDARHKAWEEGYKAAQKDRFQKDLMRGPGEPRPSNPQGGGGPYLPVKEW